MKDASELYIIRIISFGKALEFTGPQRGDIHIALHIKLLHNSIYQQAKGHICFSLQSFREQRNRATHKLFLAFPLNKWMTYNFCRC